LRMDFDVPRALSLSLVQVLLSAALVVFAAKALTTQDASSSVRMATVRYDGTALSAVWIDSIIIIAASVLVLPVLLAIVLNGAQNIFVNALLIKSLGTSLMIAMGSCAICLPIAWGMAHALITHPKHRAFFTGLSLGGYILPPAVVATGWFLAVRLVEGGVLLSALLMAIMNALMSLPFVLTVLAPAMERHANQHDRLCAQLAITGWNRARHIDVPALKGPLAQAVVMAFVLSMGDLTAVILLGSQGLLTLPGLVQQQMGHYQSDAAGGTALILAALCMGLAFWGQRLSRWT
jgi:thiamine transport system permease protein